MKKVSIMEAQHNLAKVIKQVEEGSSVYITRRGKVVARLEAPPEEEETLIFPDFEGRARKTWGGEQWEGSSTDELLDDTRGDR